MTNFIGNIAENRICGALPNSTNIEDCANDDFCKECGNIMKCQNTSFPAETQEVSLNLLNFPRFPVKNRKDS